MEAVIGIDIGGTNFRMGAVDRNSQMYDFRRYQSPEVFKGSPIDELYGKIKDYMASHPELDCGAVSIGIPSIVSKDRKTLYSTPNLKGFDNINLADPLSERLGIPVFVDRDVNYLLQNDISSLGIAPKGLIAGFYIGTGFGNAILIDGKFLRGKNGAAGELGHIPLYGVSDKCTCGNASCAETRCSGKRLESLAAEHFPGTPIREVFTHHGKSPVIERFVRDLAIPIATEINILDPDKIIIGGGVVTMPNFPQETLTAAVKELVRKPYPYQNLDISLTSHTSESGVKGGAMYAFATVDEYEIKRKT